MKTTIITGVGKGIGKALAGKFQAEGWRVIGTVFKSPGSPDADIHELDLSSPDSIRGFAEELSSNGVRADVLINNAGAQFDEDDTALHADKLRKTLEVNTIGTADLTERLLPILSSDAHIVNISSAAGSISEADDTSASHFPYHYPAYKISKAALNMYARTLAVRLSHEGSGIIVSCVHPGWVRTDMGGDEAPVTPEEAAGDIYDLAVSRPETGQFWFKGDRYPW